MNIVLFLAPASVALGLLALGAFLWTINARQYDDPRGDAERILTDTEGPLPESPRGAPRS